MNKSEIPSSLEYSDDTIQDDSDWDSLGNVDFYQDAQSEQYNNQLEQHDDSIEDGPISVEQFVERNYDIEAMIRGSVYEGGDTQSRSSYSINFALENLLSERSQEEVIAALMSSDQIDDRYLEQAKIGLAYMISDSPLIYEIAEDPTLRHRRADYMAGRLNFSVKDQKTSTLMDLLWNSDEHFYESEEARGLLSDKDYLFFRYDLKERLEKAKELHPEASEESLANSLASTLSGFLNNIVDKDIATVETLCNDPYLRFLHSKTLDLYDQINATDRPMDEDLTSLWRADRFYKDSSEYGMALDKFIEANPDIYTEVDEDAVDQDVLEMIEKIPDRKLIEVLKVYERDKHRGDKALFGMLLPYLGLKDNPPKLEYEPKPGVVSGKYSEDDHLIVIHEEQSDSDAQEDRRSSVFSLFDAFKTKPIEDDVFDRIAIVSHELRHAYQHVGKNVPVDKKEKYDKNSDVYLDYEKYGLENYRKQLIEVDAYAFGRKLGERSKELYDRMKGK